MGSVLTPKEKARLIKVRKCLSEGINPYTLDNLDEEKKLGVGVHDKKDIKIRERSEKETELLEKKWGNRTHVKPPDYLDDVNLGKSTPPIPVEYVACSYCGKVLHTIRDSVTYGSGKTKKKVSEQVVERVTDAGLVREIIEKVTHYSEKTVACSQCVLNLLPNGSDPRDSRKIKFPEDEG